MVFWGANFRNEKKQIGTNFFLNCKLKIFAKISKTTNFKKRKLKKTIF